MASGSMHWINPQAFFCPNCMVERPCYPLGKPYQASFFQPKPKPIPKPTNIPTNLLVGYYNKRFSRSSAPHGWYYVYGVIRIGVISMVKSDSGLNFSVVIPNTDLSQDGKVTPVQVMFNQPFQSIKSIIEKFYEIMTKGTLVDTEHNIKLEAVGILKGTDANAKNVRDPLHTYPVNFNVNSQKYG